MWLAKHHLRRGDQMERAVATQPRCHAGGSKVTMAAELESSATGCIAGRASLTKMRAVGTADPRRIASRSAR